MQNYDKFQGLAPGILYVCLPGDTGGFYLFFNKPHAIFINDPSSIY